MNRVTDVRTKIIKYFNVYTDLGMYRVKRIDDGFFVDYEIEKELTNFERHDVIQLLEKEIDKNDI